VHTNVTNIVTTEGDEVEKPHAKIGVDLDAQKLAHVGANDLYAHH
jgi:hypothetical protein